jgi:hypothetical protein
VGFDHPRVEPRLRLGATVSDVHSAVGAHPLRSRFSLRPHECLRNNYGFPRRRDCRTAVKFVAEVECFTNPMAERVVVGTCQDAVSRVASRRHEQRISAIQFSFRDVSSG